MAATNLSISTIRPVKVIDQVTLPAGEALAVGSVVCAHTTSGTAYLAHATISAVARAEGVALTATGASQTVTVVRKGYLDVGNALDSLNFGTPVWVSDDTAGGIASAMNSTASTKLVVGTVVPAFGATTADKLLRVDM